MDKENVVYMHGGILFSHKESNLLICKKLDGTGRHHVSKISQSQKDKWCMFFLKRIKN
jgi:hypothetical protein